MTQSEQTPLQKLESSKRSYEFDLIETYMPSAIILVIIFFIIGMSCYFSGYSKYVGGKPMKHIDVTILKMCYNSNDRTFDDWEIYARQINGGKTCNIKTGYDLNKKSDCTKLFSNRFAVGSNHTVYYNEFNDTCMTYTQANTLSIIGFIFFMFVVISMILICIYSKELNEFIINDDRERERIRFRIQEINVEIQEEYDKINDHRTRIRTIVENNNSNNSNNTETNGRQIEMNGITYYATPVESNDIEKNTPVAIANVIE
jgi:hypothetical protein